MKTPKLAVLLLISGLVATSAHGQFWDGNKAYDLCKSNRTAILSYVIGVYDREVAFGTIPDVTGKPFDPKEFVCLPVDVRAGQLADVVCQHLEKHPEQRQWPAAALASDAIRKAWPCKQ